MENSILCLKGEFSAKFSAPKRKIASLRNESQEIFKQTRGKMLLIFDDFVKTEMRISRKEEHFKSVDA